MELKLPRRCNSKPSRPSNPSTAQATTLSQQNLINLDVSLNQSDKYEESERINQRTLDGYEQVYGPDHELTVKVRHCYGHVLTSQWKTLEGSSLHTRSYMGLEEMLGSHPDAEFLRLSCQLVPCNRQQTRNRETVATSASHTFRDAKTRPQNHSRRS